MQYPLHKLAERIEMSFDIPDSEKQIAKEAIEYFDSVVSGLKLMAQHLDVIYNPFSSNSDIPTESVIRYRGLLTRFSQKLKENYEENQKLSLKAVQKLDRFSTGDSDVEELINSYVESYDTLSDKVSQLLTLFQKEYRDSSFRESVLAIIDGIKSDIKDMEGFVADRVINHIDTNILAKDWIKDQAETLGSEIKNTNTNLIQRLFEERQKKLENNFPGGHKDQQAMNPSDAPKAGYPGSMTTMPGSLGGLE